MNTDFDSVSGRLIKYLLLLTAFAPLVVTGAVIFPYSFGKVIFFRALVETVLVLFLLRLGYRFYTGNVSKAFDLRDAFRELRRNPLVIAIVLFLFSYAISTIFAINGYRAFWGDLERGGGLFGMLHYVAFFILTALIFDKKDWFRFIRLSLFVGVVLIVQALLEYASTTVAPNVLPRPGSFLGNPAFLATHMVFILAFSTILLFEADRGGPSDKDRVPPNAGITARFWRYLALALIPLAILTIFLTGTRGAMVGLSVGVAYILMVLILAKPAVVRRHVVFGLSLRTVSAVLLGGFILVFSTFLFTKDHPFWQTVPGVNRVAEFAVQGFEHESVKSRLNAWRTGIAAFGERPTLGWGPENYLIAYQKHYKQAYAPREEGWFDRAHNMVIDVAVMQGVLGLIIYAGVFVCVFYLLFSSIPGYLRMVLAGLVAAYFVQNLFLFDQVASYIAFFAFLGFLSARSGPRWARPNESVLSTANVSSAGSAGARRAFAALILFSSTAPVLYSLYQYNYLPYRQFKAFHTAFEILDNPTVAEARFREAMYPHNFAQYNIRGDGVEDLLLENFFFRPEYINDPRYRPLAMLLIDGVDEIIKSEPYDVKLHLREAQMLHALARATGAEPMQPLLKKKAEDLLRDAASRAPYKQSIYYMLSFNLAYQGRFREAIEAAEHAIGLNPRLASAHLNLAVVSLVAGEKPTVLSALAKMEELDPALESLGGAELNHLMEIYGTIGRLDKIAAFIMMNVDRNTDPGVDKKYYKAALYYYSSNKDRWSYDKVVRYMRKH